MRVDAIHSDELKHRLTEHGMLLWTGAGGHGTYSVGLDNPVALLAIDDLVLADAVAGTYWCRIDYECVVPYFNFDRGVN